MKVYNYECDLCKTLSKKSYLLSVEIKTQILNNGDTKPTEGTPFRYSAEVCSKDCGVKFIANSFDLMSDSLKATVKGGETK